MCVELHPWIGNPIPFDMPERDFKHRAPIPRIASQAVETVEIRADGIHLPAALATGVETARLALGDTAVISTAAHDEDDLLRAAARGADACLYSPIFASPGKGTPLGVDALSRARARLDVAGFRGFGLIALGGVDRDNAHACLEAGADGVAAIRADLSCCEHGVATTGVGIPR